jgi:MYXO-CTERM domain-containing protein
VDDDCDGHAEDDGDCDDTMAEVFPGAPELVDGVDNDCDGAVDESDGPVSDGDGDGWSPGDGDCDDAAAAVYPGAAETCNGIDDDCNGLVDEDEACGGVALAGCGACAVESGATSARGLGSLLLLLLASIVRRRTFGPEAGAGYSGPSARPPR